MRKHSTKLIAVIAGSAAAVALSGVAYAYWTTTGSGTGSATAGSPAAAKQVTISQSGALTGFVLGTVKDVNVTAHNDATYSQNIGSITVTVDDVKDSNNVVTCASSNWLVTPATNSIGTIGTGENATSAVTKVATLTLKDLATNQDGCQGVTPVLNFSAAKGA